MTTRKAGIVGKLGDIASYVPSGSRVGVGGLLSERRPVAALVALAASGVGDLELVCLTGSIDIDVAVGLGAVARVRSSFVSLGMYGFAPMLAAAREVGDIDVPVETEMSIVAGLRAAIAGIGFTPMRAWDGTDLGAERLDVKSVICPYTGQELVAFPALALDCAVIHVPSADRSGNCFVASDLGVDVELLRAARTRIVTTEEIVDDLDPGLMSACGGTMVPGFDVDVLIEAPRGASPTGCIPHYSPDWALIDRYANGGASRVADLLQALAGARP